MNNIKKTIFRTQTDELPPPEEVFSFVSNCGGGYVILISTITLDTPAAMDTNFTVRTDVALTGDCSDTIFMTKTVTVLSGQTYGTSPGCGVSGQTQFPDGGIICSSYVV